MKRTGPLTTEETTNQTYLRIRRAQVDVEESGTFRENKARFNLQKFSSMYAWEVSKENTRLPSL